jgi:diaminopimelate epimerase
MSIAFSKYAGCGNDFILIDNRVSIFPENHPSLIQKLCRRALGIGADGVILLENSSHSDFKMRIFNADGQEAEMCGNGIRCLMKFIHSLGHTQKSYRIETFLRPLLVQLCGDQVSVEMGSPLDIRWNIPLTIEGIDYVVHYLDTGVPHVILFTENVQTFDLNFWGPKFRYHPAFSPKGTNFNVVQVGEDGTLWNRTYERGVEAETLACGTGCVAAALAAHHILGLRSPIQVRTRSEESLTVAFTDLFDSIVMTGPATQIFSGHFEVSP